MENQFNILDLNCRLLKGSTVHIDNIAIKPKTIGEIVEYGYQQHSTHLSLLTSSVKELFENEIEEELQELDLFTFVLNSFDQNLIVLFIQSLCYMLDLDINKLSLEGENLIFDDTSSEDMTNIIVINKDSFQLISDILKYQNCIRKPSGDSFIHNPNDERTRKLIEKIKKGREKVAQAKAKEGGGSDIDFHSVISSVSAKSNTLSKFNIWDLTVYQLYDEFTRIEMIDGYETSIMAMLKGVSVKDLKHWASKIED